MKKKIGFVAVLTCIILVSIAQARGRSTTFTFAANPLSAYGTQF